MPYPGPETQICPVACANVGIKADPFSAYSFHLPSFLSCPILRGGHDNLVFLRGTPHSPNFSGRG